MVAKELRQLKQGQNSVSTIRLVEPADITQFHRYMICRAASTK